MPGLGRKPVRSSTADMMSYPVPRLLGEHLKNEKLGIPAAPALAARSPVVVVVVVMVAVVHLLDGLPEKHISHIAILFDISLYVKTGFMS